tara:strand:- start:43 stop:759 length:717 start_codon:yes stop_codon:yes gene_type:complete
MINDVYLYFSDDFTKTKASTQAAAQTITIADGAPFAAMMDGTITDADRINGKGFFHNGLVSLTMNAAHNDASADVHVFGTHYGTVADDAVVQISPFSVIYAAGSGTGVFTLKTTTQDPVYGIDASSTDTENGFTLKLEKPYAVDQAIVKPASQLLNITSVDNNSTILTFKPTTGDTANIDTVEIHHTAGKHKEFAEALSDVVTDPRNQGKMIKFADGFNELYFGNNASGMDTVDLTID